MRKTEYAGYTDEESLQAGRCPECGRKVKPYRRNLKCPVCRTEYIDFGYPYGVYESRLRREIIYWRTRFFPCGTLPVENEKAFPS